MTLTHHRGFAISRETAASDYAIRDESGYWVGDQGTLAFAKERIDEIIASRGAAS